MSREGLKQTYEHFSDSHPIAASIGETAVLFGLRYALEKGGDKLGVSLGHGRKNRHSKQKMIEEHPVIATGLATVVAPVTEELMFRELPSRVLEHKGYENGSNGSKKAKLATAALFAAMHSGPDGIPLPQFLGGLNYGRIHEKRGLKASVAAHVTNNALYAARHIITKKRK